MTSTRITLGDKAIFWGTIISLVIAVTSVTAFSFSTFETKDDAKEKKSDIIQRLDRIENKIDGLKN